jgi:hypothetical protein
MIEKRNEIYEQMMYNQSFMEIYNSQLLSDDDQEVLYGMLQQLDIYIHQLEDGLLEAEEENVRVEAARLIKEMEAYV